MHRILQGMNMSVNCGARTERDCIIWAESAGKMGSSHKNVFILRFSISLLVCVCVCVCVCLSLPLSLSLSLSLSPSLSVSLPSLSLCLSLPSSLTLHNTEGLCCFWSVQDKVKNRLFPLESRLSLVSNNLLNHPTYVALQNCAFRHKWQTEPDVSSRQQLWRVKEFGEDVRFENTTQQNWKTCTCNPVLWELIDPALGEKSGSDPDVDAAGQTHIWKLNMPKWNNNVPVNHPLDALLRSDGPWIGRGESGSTPDVDAAGQWPVWKQLDLMDKIWAQSQIGPRPNYWVTKSGFLFQCKWGDLRLDSHWMRLALCSCVNLDSASLRFG